MAKNKINSVILTVLILCIVAVIGLTAYSLLPPAQGNIQVHLVENESNTIMFEELQMLPGEEYAFTVSLYGKGDGSYAISLRLNAAEMLTLEQYVRAKIETPDGVVYDGLLSTLFEEEASFSCGLSATEAYDVSITYYLPVETGNEAQNAEAKFELLITARKE